MQPSRPADQDDPFATARADVAPFAALTPQQRFAQFLDVLAFAEVALRRMPEPELLRKWRALDAVDDPGRWWERVPQQ
jgi:hypothetical protein